MIIKCLLVSVSIAAGWLAGIASSTATRVTTVILLLSAGGGGGTITPYCVDCVGFRIAPERLIKETERVIHPFSFDGRSRL